MWYKPEVLLMLKSSCHPQNDLILYDMSVKQKSSINKMYIPWPSDIAALLLSCDI